MPEYEIYIPKLGSETAPALEAFPEKAYIEADHGEILDEYYYPPEVSLYQPGAGKVLQRLQGIYNSFVHVDVRGANADWDER